MTETRFRTGTVAIVGRPNVGKSTLLNLLVGQKISITSRKPQTTRNRITGILTRTDAQLVFVDTPGFQTQHRNALNRLMNRSVGQALQEVDVVVWVIEALKFDARGRAELTAIGIEHEGEAFALIVDAVGEVIRLDHSTLEPLPVHLDRVWSALAMGVHRLSDQLLVILDLDAVLDLDLRAAA